MRATRISVTLPLTTLETSSQIRAFRQRAFPFCANFFSTPLLCRAPLWSRARSSAAALLTPQSTMFLGRRGSTSAALAKEKSAPAKWDFLGFDDDDEHCFERSEGIKCKGAARYHLPSKGAQQPGRLLVHRQPGHFPPGCWGFKRLIWSSCFPSKTVSVNGNNRPSVLSMWDPITDLLIHDLWRWRKMEENIWSRKICILRRKRRTMEEKWENFLL